MAEGVAAVSQTDRKVLSRLYNLLPNETKALYKTGPLKPIIFGVLFEKNSWNGVSI